MSRFGAPRRPSHLRLLKGKMRPGNDEDWRKVEVVKLFITFAQKGDPTALELIVDAYDEVFCPSDTMSKVHAAAQAIENYGRMLSEQPERRTPIMGGLSICLENVDRRFSKLNVAQLELLLHRYDPNKTQKGVDGILAEIINRTSALDLDHNREGERRDAEEIRRHVASLMKRKR